MSRDEIATANSIAQHMIDELRPYDRTTIGRILRAAFGPAAQPLAEQLTTDQQPNLVH